MSAAALASYYIDGFGSERHRQGQLVNARINVDMIRGLLPMADLRSVLDVGTGYGYLLKELVHRHGIVGVGVELSNQEAAYGRDALGLDVRNDSLTLVGLEERSFDLVACFEVIEHIADPIDFMKNMLRFVKPSGYVLVMTDNFESAAARAMGPSFPKWIPHSHVSHFSPRTLKRLFSEVGVTIVGERSYTPWEILARRYLGDHARRPEDAYDLASVLETEMHGRYRLFQLRRRINTVWAKVTAKRNLDGALMYLVGRSQTP